MPVSLLYQSNKQHESRVKKMSLEEVQSSLVAKFTGDHWRLFLNSIFALQMSLKLPEKGHFSGLPQSCSNDNILTKNEKQSQIQIIPERNHF
jgi:hypothetical protein